MNKFQLYLIKFFFSAFLPHTTESEANEDYYSLLGLTSNANQDEIKKAYRKKSLQHHPDKVAQFAKTQNKSAEEIQAQFVRIKEAYETLSEPKKRTAYDVLGAEGGKLINTYLDSKNDHTSQGSGFDFYKIVQNFAEANFGDRCKLFSMVLVLVAFFLIIPILICVKIDGILSGSQSSLAQADWMVLLSPLWVLNILIFWYDVFAGAILAAMRVSCIFALEILLALKWDASVDYKYSVILIPIYIHQILLIVHNLVVMKMVQKDIARMVTVRYLEKTIIPGLNEEGDENVENQAPQRTYQDLTEEELEDINEAYIIITEDPDVVGDDQSVDAPESFCGLEEEVKLSLAIASSPEYEYANMIRSHAFESIIKTVVYRMPFLVILTLQLDQDRGWNWNIVFIPIWIEVILATLTACFGTCLGPMAIPNKNEEEVQIFQVDLDDDAAGDDSNKSEANEDESPCVESDQEQTSLLTQEEPIDIGKTDIEAGQENAEAAAISPLVETKTEEPITSEVTKDEPLSQPIEPNAVPSQEIPSAANNEEYNQYDNMGMQMDSEAAEEHAKSMGSCCYYIYFIIALSLFTVKLNESTDSDEDNNGFSSLWILFPLFFIAFIITLSCACCIFADPTKMMNMEANNDAAGEAEDDILSELKEQEGKNASNDNVLEKSTRVDEARDEVVQQFPIAIDMEEDKQDLEANNDDDMDDLD
ncbi:hypothetical protein CTEN210_01340 [Chaetoceros tenuissimus]|uniref:J domain-containing protein n=1 Tax=Chaetoceros tenuissimus TaxID=426638 RepID=A0AAD3GZM4_9STRA|nr:hypothetical protein CTEN210_01340 [Chaetoceros tenuissimus]